MNYSALIMLVILTAFFIGIGQAFTAILCFFGILILIILEFLKKTSKTTVFIGKELTKGIGNDLEKAKGQAPSAKAATGVVDALSRQFAEFGMSDTQNRRTGLMPTARKRYMAHEPFKGLTESTVNRKLYNYKASVPIKGIGESAENVIKLFKKLFD